MVQRALRVAFLKQCRVLELAATSFSATVVHRRGVSISSQVAVSGLGCRKVGEVVFLFELPRRHATSQVQTHETDHTRHHVHYITRSSSLQMCLDMFFHLDKSLEFKKN